MEGCEDCDQVNVYGDATAGSKPHPVTGSLSLSGFTASPPSPNPFIFPSTSTPSIAAQPQPHAFAPVQTSFISALLQFFVVPYPNPPPFPYSEPLLFPTLTPSFPQPQPLRLHSNLNSVLFLPTPPCHLAHLSPVYSSFFPSACITFLDL